MVAKLLPISNQEIGATSARDKPKKKHKIQHDFVRNKQGKEMNVTMKALIKESTRVTKLLGPIGGGGYDYSKNKGCGHRGACCSLRLLRYICGYKDHMQSY